VKVNGRNGYGRVLLKRSPWAFVEFYGFVADHEPALRTFEGVDCILRIYVEDSALTRQKRWKVIGNLPVGAFEMPLFWLEDALTQQLYLVRDPITQADRKVTSHPEIRRLRALPATAYGYEAAESELVAELRKREMLKQ